MISDKSMAIRIVRESINMSIFSFLCAIDVVKAIENGPDKGVFRLIFQKGNEQILINDPKGDFLHDLFNAE
jgi:hypothetical protein